MANSTVVVLMTSRANDQLVNFNVAVTSMSLTDTAGSSVTLLSNPNANLLSSIEFMHLANHPEPLTTISVPQGMYTSATVKIGFCSFTDVTFDRSTGALTRSTYAQGLCSQGTGNATVNFTTPIAVAGPVTALSLNLQVSQSFTLTGTVANAAFTISPTFTLSSLPLATHPSNSKNGKVAGLAARVTAVNASANTFTVQTGDSISLTVNSANNTTYEGIAGFSALAVGTLVDLDFVIQADGSFVASRVSVPDPSAATTAIGPFFVSGAQAGEFVTIAVEHQGCTLTGTPFCGNIFRYDGTTKFSISSQFGNLQSLPFVPSFGTASLLPGQNISVFSSGTPDARSVEATTTITLEPQTLNGTVTGVSTEGGFTVYTVSLAPYDLIPTLQNYSGTLIHLNEPNTVTVYVGANTQLFNSKAINPGGVFRFTGLVFDDMGTLRLDCGQVDDGVAE